MGCFFLRNSYTACQFENSFGAAKQMCQLLTAEALSALQLVDDTERQLGGNATM